MEAFVILLRLIDLINQIVQQRLRPQSHWSEWIELQKLRIKLTERSIWTHFTD